MGKEKQRQQRLMDVFLRMTIGGLMGLVICLFILILGAVATSKSASGRVVASGVFDGVFGR